METEMKVIEYSDASNYIGPIVKELINKFEGKELEITSLDFFKLSFVWFNPKKTQPNWVAKIIKTPSYYKCLGMRPLVIVCLKPVFDESTPEKIKAILFHELMHISFNDFGEYKLIDHDIKDFESLISKIGLRYEKAEQMFGKE